jgi:hypothetical protein
MSAHDEILRCLIPSLGDREGRVTTEEILAALTAAGYAVVPREATPSIRTALLRWAHPDDQWRDALAAGEGNADDGGGGGMSAECRPPENTPDGTVFRLRRDGVMQSWRWRGERWVNPKKPSYSMSPENAAFNGWTIAEPPHE